MTVDKTDQTIVQKYHQLSRKLKHLFGFALFLLIYTLLGFFIIPFTAKILVEKKLPEILYRPVTVEKIKMNPFTLTLTMQNFAIKNKVGSKNFLSFNYLFLNLQSISLFKQALIIKSFSLKGLQIHLTQNKDESFNFSDLLKGGTKTREKEKNSEEKPLFFSFHNIEIKNGSVQFDDQRKNVRHTIESFNLAVPVISNLDYDIESFVHPALNAVINNTKLDLAGKTKPFHKSKETSIDIKFEDLNVSYYLSYISNPTKLNLQSAFLDVDARLSYLHESKKKQKLSLVGELVLKKINIVDQKNKSYFEFPKISLSLAPSNLFEKEIRIADLAIESPKMNFERVDNGKISPLNLLESTNTQKKKEGDEKDDKSGSNKKTEDPVKLTIEDFRLVNGTINFSDLMVGAFKTSLNPIDVAIEDFTTIPGKKASYTLFINTESEEKIGLAGNFSLSPLSAEGNFSLQGAKATKYLPYYKDMLLPSITSGQIDIKTDYFFLQKNETTETKLANSYILFSKFILEEKNGKKKLITVPHFEISKTNIDVEKQNIFIGSLFTRDTTVQGVKEKDGTINLTKIFAAQGKDSTTLSEKASSAEGEKKEPRPFTITLRKGKVENYSVAFEDNALTTPVQTKITDLTMDIDDISTKKKSVGKVAFALNINKEGRITGKGEVGLSPTLLSLGLDIKTLALKPFQPYVAEQMNIAITDGNTSLQSTIKVTEREKEEFQIQVNGDAQIQNLKTVDTLSGEDLVSFKSFNLRGLHYLFHPQEITIRDVELLNLYSKIIVASDGTVNLATLTKNSKEAAPPEDAPKENENQTPEEKQAGPKIEINTLSLTGAKMEFLDQSISPAFSTTLHEFHGTITGLSSQEEKMATINLAGKLNQHAPFSIGGKVNPLKEGLFADIKVDLHDIDLAPISPYTGKFIGYKVEKGKLTLNLKYTIEGNELEAENKAFLDQFTLGEEVASPDAASLPINLAIALLKNRKGEIYLDVPINGKLDDPKFKPGKVIGQVVLNLIAKAATSPFALLGALIPDGEDLQYISFEPGEMGFTKKTSSKLEKMAKVLYERPGLRMDIIGKVSPREDRKALKEKQFQQIVIAQKILTLSRKQAENEVLPESVRVSREEYPHFLKLAFNAKKAKENKQISEEVMTTPKTKETVRPDPLLISDQEEESAEDQPDAEIREEKVIPVEEMEKYLKEGLETKDEELRLLAIQRANSVLDYLVKKGQIESERLFIIEPKLPESDADKKLMGMQAEMVIK